MSAELPSLYQNLSHITTQNGSQGVYGHVDNVYFGNHRSPEEANTQKAEACRNALFISNPDSDREELISEKGIRVSGTCEWIKKNKNYRSWERGEIRLLWITGEPGKGKTMLSIFLTEDLEEEYSKDRERRVIYHFCVHKKSDTGIALLRGLIYQILNERSDLTKDVLTYFETPEKTQQALSSLETLWIVFVKLTKRQNLGTMLCVIDGLDECDEETRRFLLPRFVRQFGSIESAAGTRTNFRLLVVSRDLEGLEDCTKIDLDTDPDSRGERDMQLFICEKVDELFRKKKFDNTFRSLVEDTLFSKAGDTFLWVGFVVNDLLKMQTWSQVRQQLKSLPVGLSNIYGRMLLEIPSEERNIALLVLQWVCLTRRPLKLLELAEAIALETTSYATTSKRDEKVPDLVNLKQQAMDAIRLCGQILKVKDEEVTFVHKTARDYLLRREKEDDQVLKCFRFKRKETNIALARACFQYIAQSDLRNSTTNLEQQLPSRSSPFLQYAICYWPEHARLCYIRVGELFEDFYSVFESNPQLRKNWWKNYRQNQRHSTEQTIPTLHMVSYLGIVPWLEALLGMKKSSIPDVLNEKDEGGLMPLDWAAKGRNEQAVETLLEHGSGISKKMKCCGQAFPVTAHVRFASRPVKRRTHVTADHRGQTILHQAVLWRNQKILEMLLDRGADVNVKNRFGVSALHTAIGVGEETIAQFPYIPRSNVNLISGHIAPGKTALERAITHDNSDIVKFLVSKGADLESRDERGRTPLHLAAELGQEETVMFLIGAGADVFVKDKGYRTVLHATCSKNMGQVAQQLLLRGLDAKAKDIFGTTMLHKIADTPVRRGDQGLARLLIFRGVDVKAVNSHRTTALHMAARSDNTALVQLLLDEGAEINAQNRLGNMPLHSALYYRGYGESAKLLISRGANVNAPDDRGWVPLRDYIPRNDSQ